MSKQGRNQKGNTDDNLNAAEREEQRRWVPPSRKAQKAMDDLVVGVGIFKPTKTAELPCEPAKEHSRKCS